MGPVRRSTFLGWRRSTQHPVAQPHAAPACTSAEISSSRVGHSSGSSSGESAIIGVRMPPMMADRMWPEKALCRLVIVRKLVTPMEFPTHEAITGPGLSSCPTGGQIPSQELPSRPTDRVFYQISNDHSLPGVLTLHPTRSRLEVGQGLRTIRVSNGGPVREGGEDSQFVADWLLGLISVGGRLLHLA